jgi:outer membrane protein assembly factor BamB
VSWQLGDGAVESIDQPAGCPEGECFVRYDDAIARIDVPRRLVLWRAPLSADVSVTSYAKDLVIASHRAGLTAYDRATGERRWFADTGLSPQDSLRDDGAGRAASVGQQVVLVPSLLVWQGGVGVFALTDGRRLGSFSVDGGVLAVTERDGRIFTAYRRSDGIFIDEREVSRLGASLARHDSTITVSDRDGSSIAPDGESIIVHNRTGAVRFDLRTRTVRPYPFAFLHGSLYREAGQDLAMVYTPADTWISAVLDPASGKALFQEVTGVGDDWHQTLFAYHLNRGRVVRVLWDRNGKNGILCRNVADGKEAWFVQGRETWARRYHALVMVDRYVVALSTQAEGTFTYDLIDVETGAVAATGPLPGYADSGLMPALAVGGSVLSGTRQGLCALAPTTAAAATANGGQPSPSSHAMARLSILPAPGAMLIDGHLDDWTGVEAVELRRPEDVRGDRSLAQPPAWSGPQDCAASIRLCWDAANVYASVRVVDDRRRGAVPGSSTVTGDAVLIAFDPQEDRFRGSQPLLCQLASVDGLPVATLSGAVGNETERVQMRVALGADSSTYELAVPWSALRGDQNHRPGDHRAMRIGVMLVDRDGAAAPDALEMGRGLAAGVDQTRWRPCVFVTEKEVAITGLAFSLFGGRATWGHAGRIVRTEVAGKDSEREEAYLADDLPKGATPAADGGDDWTWVKENPPPGATQGHRSSIAPAHHQHFFTDGPALRLRADDTLFAWVYLDPANPPVEVILQWNMGGSWEHRAYWGENQFRWGEDGTESRHYMGPLPKLGSWVRLEVPPEVVGLR